MPNQVDRLGGASSSLSMKAPCRLGTTANITLSGYQTIDGTLPTASEHEDLRRILVKNQTNAAENGIRIMSDGAWERAKDFDGSNDFRKGTWVFVWGGSTQSAAYRVSSTMDPATFDIDTTSIAFTAAAATDYPLSSETSPTLGANLTAGGYNIKFTDETGILDSNGNEQVLFHIGSTAAANYVRISNSAASSAPAIDAKGDDTNIDLTLAGKGSGVVKSNGAKLANGANLASFHVTKSSTDQTTVADDTLTQITFDTEAYDVGSYFASNAWTPPAGKVHLNAALYMTGAITAGNAASIAIYKDGAVYKRTVMYAVNTGDAILGVSAMDDASSTNAYTVYGSVNVSSGTVTVKKQSDLTYFQGTMIS